MLCDSDVMQRPPGENITVRVVGYFFNIPLSCLHWNPLGQSRANPSYTNVAFPDFNTRLGCLKGDGACQELNIAVIPRIICGRRVKKKERERKGRSLSPSSLASAESQLSRVDLSPAPQPYGGAVTHDHMWHSCPTGVSFFFSFL